MSQPRWWRMGVLIERDGDPWTWTFHVRALSERRARGLVAQRVGGEHQVYACHPSDPLPKARQIDEIAAEAGPFHRSWKDPLMIRIRNRIGSVLGEDVGA